jgi:hypothetical protein
MEAATVEQNLQAAQPSSRTVRFYSRGRNERLIRRPAVLVTDALGRQETRQEAYRIEFAPEGWYTATEGKAPMLDSEGWLASDEELAERGLPPRGEPRDEVQALRSHKQFNVRFWEEGNEPDRARPLEEDFIAELTSATMLLQQEQATHQRPVLLRSATAAVEQITAALEAQAGD